MTDFACLNKVELLPWDLFGLLAEPHDPVPDGVAYEVDEIAAPTITDDFPAIRTRYFTDPHLQVSPTSDL